MNKRQQHSQPLSRAALAGILSLSLVLAACGGSESDAPDGADTPKTLQTTPEEGSSAAIASATHTGEGTFYGATGQGNCSFDPSPNDLMVAAMNQTDYAGSAACGEYASVTGPKGRVTVRIVDRCPECRPGDIDLSTQAFAKIADPIAGRVPITWNTVPGNVSGPVSYRYKEGSTRWWLGIQLRNHRVGVRKLEIKPRGSATWIAVQRMEYNYFVHPTPIAAGPVQVRVTAASGATLMQTLPEPQGGLVIQGNGQFP